MRETSPSRSGNGPNGRARIATLTTERGILASKTTGWNFQIEASTVPMRTASDVLSEFSDFLQGDYRAGTGRVLSRKSLRLAIQHIRVFSRWWQAQFGEVLHPAELTNYDLMLYRSWSLDQERVKAATWNSRLWALGILCKMIELRHGIAGLTNGVEQKSQVRSSTQHRSLADDEYHRLMRMLEQHPRRAVTDFEYQCALRDCAAVSLMVHAGLRVEEVTLLDLDDITIGERSGAVLVRNGKGSKERTVPLSLAARRSLSAWLQARAVGASTALFVGKDSERLSVRTLQRIVQAMGCEIQVQALTPHWLRYTFAKRMERNGVGIETIRDLLGHTSIEITGRYLRSSLAELQAAVEAAGGGHNAFSSS